MIDNGRSCEEILHQILAVRSAISKIGIELVKDETRCLIENNAEHEAVEKLILQLVKV